MKRNRSEAGKSSKGEMSKLRRIAPGVAAGLIGLTGGVVGSEIVRDDPAPAVAAPFESEQSERVVEQKLTDQAAYEITTDLALNHYLDIAIGSRVTVETPEGDTWEIENPILHRLHTGETVNNHSVHDEDIITAFAMRMEGSDGGEGDAVRAFVDGVDGVKVTFTNQDGEVVPVGSLSDYGIYGPLITGAALERQESLSSDYASDTYFVVSDASSEGLIGMHVGAGGVVWADQS
jgi:hypothetical protein